MAKRKKRRKKSRRHKAEKSSDNNDKQHAVDSDLEDNATEAPKQRKPWRVVVGLAVVLAVLIGLVLRHFHQPDEKVIVKDSQTELVDTSSSEIAATRPQLDLTGIVDLAKFDHEIAAWRESTKELLRQGKGRKFQDFLTLLEENKLVSLTELRQEGCKLVFEREKILGIPEDKFLVVLVPQDHPKREDLLEGGQAGRIFPSLKVVFLAQEVENGFLRAAIVAHELGHLRMYLLGYRSGYSALHHVSDEASAWKFAWDLLEEATDGQYQNLILEFLSQHSDIADFASSQEWFDRLNDSIGDQLMREMCDPTRLAYFHMHYMRLAKVWSSSLKGHRELKAVSKALGEIGYDFTRHPNHKNAFRALELLIQAEDLVEADNKKNLAEILRLAHESIKLERQYDSSYSLLSSHYEILLNEWEQDPSQAPAELVSRFVDVSGKYYLLRQDYIGSHWAYARALTWKGEYEKVFEIIRYVRIFFLEDLDRFTRLEAYAKALQLRTLASGENR